jgi:hypothetical protein
MTSEALKTLLSTPVALMVLMLLGTIISMLKQYKDGRNNGSTITLSQYVLTVDTVIVIGVNIFAFVTLIMTDMLNFTNATAIGFAANSLSDLLTPGKGRSANIVNMTP